MDIVLSGTNDIKFIGTNERIITELVLSNREDCDTLFQGMTFCFNRFNSNITKRISSAMFVIKHGHIFKTRVRGPYGLNYF